MSISATLIITVVALVIVGGGALLLRGSGRDRADEARNYGAGLALAAAYVLTWLGMLTVFGYGRDFHDVVEGFGIASILFGTPWSILSAFLLSGVLPLKNGLFGASWEVTITVISLLGIALNAWLLFQFGQRFFSTFRVRRVAK